MSPKHIDSEVESNFKKQFGSAVRGWRDRLGISQEELAARADLHRTYISDVERGARNLSLGSIEKLAQALEVSVSQLFVPSDHAPAAEPPVNRFVEILLVEDNEDDVQMTLHAFKKARFANRVQVVRDGAEALDFIFGRKGRNPKQTPPPDVILLDLNLPKVSGLEVLRILRDEPSTRDIPVVILTVSQKDKDISECRQLGASTYIVKPVDFQRLSEATPQLNLDWALLNPLVQKRNVNT